MGGKQIICIHVGQAGVQLGNAIWELLALEQGVKLNGTLAKRYINKGIEIGISAFFNPCPTSSSSLVKYTPRALIVDTESMVIDEIRTGLYCDLFNPECLISGVEDAANLFPRGFLDSGRAILLPTLEGLRLLAESSDTMPNILLFRSLGGGTGSGFAPLFLKEIESEASKLFISEIVIFPAPDICTSIVEPYNCLLTIDQTLPCTSLTLIMDNQALYDRCRSSLDIKRPSYFNINRVISHLFSSLTSPIRFDNSVDSDFSILQTNIIPFPGIKFPITSYSPLIPNGISKCTSIHSITSELFHHNNFMLKCFPEYGEYMACALLYRGKSCSNGVIRQSLAQIKNSSLVKFVDWSPGGFKISISRQAPPNIEYSCIGKTDHSVALIANNTCLAQVLDYLLQKFDLLYKRRAFVHWFTGEGLEEGELSEARSEVTKLLIEYAEIGTINNKHDRYD